MEIDEVVSRKPIGVVEEIQVDIVPSSLSASLDTSGSVTNAEIVVN